MSAEFWSTIAQISATLASLILVGYSIFLGNIYQATQDIGERLADARQVQRGLIQLAVFSNLLNYWLPLVIALSFLLALKLNRFPQWLAWLTGMCQ